jgi:hypothetical protein
MRNHFQTESSKVSGCLRLIDPFKADFFEAYTVVWPYIFVFAETGSQSMNTVIICKKDFLFLMKKKP